MEDFELEPELMEMPTPCEHCGTTFDLNDGYASEKWHDNIVICEKCHNEEEAEIEEDDYWYDANIEISNALYGLNEKDQAWERLDKENQALIIQLVSQQSGLLTAFANYYNNEADKLDTALDIEDKHIEDFKAVYSG